MQVSYCCFLILIQVSQEIGKMVWYSHLFKNIPQLVVIYAVKGFSIINETQVAVSLEFPCFLYDPTNLGNLISYSSAFSKLSLYIWKFLIQVLLKPSLKDFEHNLTSMGNEQNCLVVRTFFSTAIIRDWNENWPFRCVVVLNMSSVKLLLQLKQAASMEPTGNTHCCSSGSWCAFCCKDSPLSLCPADFDYLLDFS